MTVRKQSPKLTPIFLIFLAIFIFLSIQAINNGYELAVAVAVGFAGLILMMFLPGSWRIQIKKLTEWVFERDEEK